MEALGIMTFGGFRRRIGLIDARIVVRPKCRYRLECGYSAIVMVYTKATLTLATLSREDLNPREFSIYTL